jgi:hypothetical protein
MLYMVEPDAPLKWSDLPADMVFRAVAQSGADLAQLEWDVADRPADPAIVRLAIRHGVRCSVGLVVDGGLVAEHDQPARIREAHRNAQQAHAALEQQNALMERLIPGWTEHDAELSTRIDESSERAAARADEEASEALDSAPDPALIDHWTALGGRLPEPL